MQLNELFDIIRGGENEKVEFKEGISSSAGKTLAAFLNTSGGILLFGINDAGHIGGVKQNDPEKELGDIIAAIRPKPHMIIEKLRVGEVVVLIVHAPKSEKLHTYGGTGYVRIGSTTRELELNEIVEKAGEFLLLRFDEAPCPLAQLTDVSAEIVEDYFRRRFESRNVKIPKTKYKQTLAMIGVISKEHITNGGVLFFTLSPQRFHPQAVVRIVEFSGSTMGETLSEKRLSGNLLALIDETYTTLSSIIRREATTRDFSKIISKSFPLEAIQEAVINALIHRNYFDPADVRIFVFSDRMEIINPGSFPPDVTAEHPVHKPRNPLLSQYVYDIGYIEKYGSGIIKMKELCLKNGYPQPEFLLSGRQTKVTFWFMPLKIRTALPDLDDTNRRILDYLLKKKSANSTELVSLSGLSKNSTVDRLNFLIAKGLLSKSGKGKATTYSLA